MFKLPLPPFENRVRVIIRTLFYKIKSWCGGSPNYLLFFTSIIAVSISLPLLYVIVSALQTDFSRWLKLLDARIPKLMWNTLSLAAVVTFFSITIGFSLSWLVVRSDIPAKKYWQWLLALPMVIPSYVGAMCYISIFGPRGLVMQIIGYPIVEIYGFFGACFVLTMFTYPYVYLISMAALKKINMNYEEAGLSAGLTYRKIFSKIIIPIMRPAIGAGGILVALYALSDFGTVAMLRYTTFTSAIYFQVGSFDQNTASILSTVLIATILLFLYVETKTREKQVFYQISGTYRIAKIVSLGNWKWLTFLIVAILFLFAVIIPMSVLAYWSAIGISQGALNADFWDYALNSFFLSFSAALLCIICSLPIIYLHSRYPTKISSIIEKTAYVGFSLPGVIVAVGIIFIFNKYIPLLYNTVVMAIFAYVIRFLPKAMQAEGAALHLVSPKLDEVARSLGLQPWKVIQKIILPIIFPAILVAGALVFVSTIKELPATLLLRPPGMDTLAIRVWIEASEHYYYQAAPSALLIILISALPLKWMLRKY